MVANHYFFFSYESLLHLLSMHSMIYNQFLGRRRGKNPLEKGAFSAAFARVEWLRCNKVEKRKLHHRWSRVTPYFVSCFWWGEIAKLATTTMLCGRHILHLRKNHHLLTKPFPVVLLRFDIFLKCRVMRSKVFSSKKRSLKKSTKLTKTLLAA